MVILGIDPGFAIVGYGVVAYDRGQFRVLSYGAIETPAHTLFEARLHQIYTELGAVFEKYRPDEVAIEKLYFSANKTTGIPVAEARGVILLSAYQHDVPVAEYTPMQVKQAVVGYGLAEKKQVIAMTTQILGLAKRPRLDDTADALAIAVCHAHTGASQLSRLMKK